MRGLAGAAPSPSICSTGSQGRCESGKNHGKDEPDGREGEKKAKKYMARHGRGVQPFLPLGFDLLALSAAAVAGDSAGEVSGSFGRSN